MYKFCHLAYNEHSILQFCEFRLTSQEDSLHGDPLGGLMSGNPSIHPLDHLRSHHWSYGRLLHWAVLVRKFRRMFNYSKRKESKSVSVLTRLHVKLALSAFLASAVNTLNLHYHMVVACNVGVDTSSPATSEWTSGSRQLRTPGAYSTHFLL